MLDFQDLFQWDRFITPTIIKTFYWLVIGLIVLFGLSGIFSALAAMAISPFGGFILLLSSIAGVVVGIVFSRIAAEFILIVFRINEHLAAIRDQGQMHYRFRGAANSAVIPSHLGMTTDLVRYGFPRKLDFNLSASQNANIAANDRLKYI